MKALYVTGSKFKILPSGEVYSNSQFPYRRWWRYLRHFDELTVVGRISETDLPPARCDLSSGPNIRFLGVPDDHGKRLKKLRSAQELKVLQNAMSNTDAVIVRASRLGWLAAAEADRREIPWAVEVVSDAWNSYWYYGNLSGKFYAPIAYFKARKWIKRAPFALYVTKQYLQTRYPSNGIQAGVSAVEIQEVNKSVLMKRLRKTQRSLYNGGIIRCGLIGNLSASYKGLNVALRALKYLREKGITVHLHNLGYGDFEAFKNMAETLDVRDLLHLDGTLPSGEPVFRWLDNMDFYIQPSLAEGQGRALIEAMSRGLPALASNCGQRELLDNDCLHRPGDFRKLALDIERLIFNNEWRKNQSIRNYEEAKKYYTETLELQRDAFWSSFKDHVKSVKNYQN